MAEREPLRMEPARKHTYICATDDWYTEDVEVSIAAKPFARGGMRACHKCVEKLLEPGGQTFSMESVAKFSMIHQGRAAKKSAFADAKMQMVAEYYGQQFNKRSPAGQKVSFVVAQVLELPSRDERSGRWASLEPMLQGEYLKFNNNAGAVLGGSLAQAFSHFSLVESQGELLICDIQGVGGSLFTDPQIHTRSGRGFGDGNLGEQGIARFKATQSAANSRTVRRTVPRRFRRLRWEAFVPLCALWTISLPCRPAWSPLLGKGQGGWQAVRCAARRQLRVPFPSLLCVLFRSSDFSSPDSAPHSALSSFVAPTSLPLALPLTLPLTLPLSLLLRSKCSELCGRLKLPKLEGQKAAHGLGPHGGMPMGGMGGMGGMGSMGGMGGRGMQMAGGPGMTVGLHGTHAGAS